MDEEETAEYLMMLRDSTASDMMVVLVGIDGVNNDEVLARCADYAYRVADALRVSRAKTLAVTPVSKESL